MLGAFARCATTLATKQSELSKDTARTVASMPTSSSRTAALLVMFSRAWPRNMATLWPIMARSFVPSRASFARVCSLEEAGAGINIGCVKNFVVGPSPIEPHLIKLIEVVGVGSPEFSVVVARGSPERGLVVEDDANIEKIRVQDELEQELQDPAATGADLTEADDEEERGTLTSKVLMLVMRTSLILLLPLRQVHQPPSPRAPSQRAWPKRSCLRQRRRGTSALPEPEPQLCLWPEN